MFDFPTEKAKLIKQDSSVIENVDAFFGNEKIFVRDASIPIEDGDIFERVLPNGLKEQYLVIDNGYFSGSAGIPAHYQIKAEKQSLHHKKTEPQVVNNYILSNEGKININSVDNSIAHQMSEEQLALFETLKSLANQLENSMEVKARIEDMEKNIGQKSFIEKYNSFIQSVANHMTIFGPFIPALTQILPKIN